MRGHRFQFHSGGGAKPNGTRVGQCASKVCAGGKVLLTEGPTPVGIIILTAGNTATVEGLLSSSFPLQHPLALAAANTLNLEK